MKRLTMFMACLFAMMAASMSASAQEVTITLTPGWTWISCPSTETMDFAEALGDFVPMEGDVIRSQWGQAIYTNGRWRGSVSQFYPGYGYKYKSNRQVPVMLTFNAQQTSSQVVVTTSEPMLITGNSAMGGGEVTVSDGTYILVKGLCWATHENPTTDDFYQEAESGVGTFSVSMTGLNISTTYYVRAYAVTPNGTVYGDQKTFTTEAGGDHAYVDLGLPSGLLWATCNVGADTPEDYGDYFSWGETQPKDTYNWSTYQHCMGDYNMLTKYCYNANQGYNGFTDYLTTLLPEDDAATANWGSDWRMPTEEEWQELYNNTNVIWTTQNGVNGRLFTASNGNSLFLPAAGDRDGSDLDDAGSDGYYWSSSLRTDVRPDDAWSLHFYSVGYSGYLGYRYYGQSVRAVRFGLQNNTPTVAINGKFTINDNGDQVYFSQGNLQYQASTNTWKFADNQYDYIGYANSNISSTYSGWIDLFGWGTSGWDCGNTYYHPWDSYSGGDWSAGGYLYGPPGLYDLTGSYAHSDWGIHNAISNGGNQTNQWRTLTQPEWAYVFNTRTTTSGIRYAKANVNNANGVILLPDDWSSSTYSLSNTNSSGANFSSNILTASQWSSLEQAGAVFLPAAGYRYETSVGNVGSQGNYWSASSYDNSTFAYCVFFIGSNLGTAHGGRCHGWSVRLVAPAEN